MLKLIRYIFYRLHKFRTSLGNPGPEPSTIIITIIIGLNIYSLIDCILIIFRTPYPNISSIILIALYGLLVYLLYKYLATEKRIKAIFKEFENISNKEKYRLNFLAIVYPLVSVLLAVFLANIVRAKEYLNW